LSQVYPIARGAAPLMTASVAVFAVGEQLAALGWCGIAILVVGVCLLSLRGARDLAHFDARSVGFALLTAVTICAYSIVDGIGARASGNAIAYSLWLFLGIACFLGNYAFVRSGGAVLKPIVAAWPRGLIGGTMQVFSYTVVLWAMTLAPIALVAALRETSVLIGAAIAVVVLKEPLRALRVAAALLIVIGLALIRLQ
jgi:drug/metabolite transporter (DMT)-like permease